MKPTQDHLQWQHCIRCTELSAYRHLILSNNLHPFQQRFWINMTSKYCRVSIYNTWCSFKGRCLSGNSDPFVQLQWGTFKNKGNFMSIRSTRSLLRWLDNLEQLYCLAAAVLIRTILVFYFRPEFLFIFLTLYDTLHTYILYKVTHLNRNCYIYG